MLKKEVKKEFGFIEKAKFFEVFFLNMINILQACSDNKLEIIKKVLKQCGFKEG